MKLKNQCPLCKQEINVQNLKDFQAQLERLNQQDVEQYSPPQVEERNPE
jgi:hypothetical protein